MRADAIIQITTLSCKPHAQPLAWYRTVAVIEHGAAVVLEVLIGLGHVFWPACAIGYLAVRFGAFS
jgi:hypothetical protein